MRATSGTQNLVPEASPVRRQEFPPRPDIVADARRFVLAPLGATFTGITDDIALLTSELVTNAILHARTDLVLEVSVMGSTVRVCVSDQGPGKPLVRSFSATAGSGRGLRLLDTLSSDWGTDVHPHGGKSIWFEIDVSRPRRSVEELAFDFDNIEAL